MAVKQGEVEKIVVKPLNKKVFKVTVEGETLLMNKKSKEVEELLDKYFKTNPRSGKVQSATKQKPLEEIIEGKIHYTEDGQVGFPAAGFKAGIVEISPKLGVYKNSVKGAVRVLGDILPIKYKKRTVNDTWGRTAGRNKTPRRIIRPCFHDWSCELTIEYNEDMISAEQIVNLLNWAGFSIGIGDWRPGSVSGTGGQFGTYKVKSTK